MTKQTAIREAIAEAQRFRCTVSVIERLRPRRGEMRYFPARPEWLDGVTGPRRGEFHLVGDAAPDGSFQTEW